MEELFEYCNSKTHSSHKIDGFGPCSNQKIREFETYFQANQIKINRHEDARAAQKQY